MSCYTIVQCPLHKVFYGICGCTPPQLQQRELLRKKEATLRGTAVVISKIPRYHKVKPDTDTP